MTQMTRFFLHLSILVMLKDAPRITKAMGIATADISLTTVSKTDGSLISPNTAMIPAAAPKIKGFVASFLNILTGSGFPPLNTSSVVTARMLYLSLIHI